MGSSHGTVGANWEVSPDLSRANMFGTEVQRYSEQTILYKGIGDEVFLALNTLGDTVKGELEGIIAADRAAGNEDEILEIRTRPYEGCRLVLEGVITREMLGDAEETPDTITVQVKLSGKTWRLVIVNTNSGPFDDDVITGTYNAAGELV